MSQKKIIKPTEGKGIKIRTIPFPIPRNATIWFGLICNENIPSLNNGITEGTENAQYFYIGL